MRYLKIGLDLDGVIVNLLPTWLRHYHDVGGELRTEEDFRTYNWERQVERPELFNKVLKSGAIFSCAEPMPGAIAGARRLISRFDTYIVTKVMPGSSRAFDAKVGWLWRHLPEMHVDRVIFTGKKHLIDVDVLVEDSGDNLDQYLAAGDRRRGFLVNHSYNRAYYRPEVTKVDSLGDVARILEEESL